MHSSLTIRAVTKRVCDFGAGLTGVLCLSPLFLVVAILIKRDSEGPVLFKQERMGKDRRSFVIYKFRTMVRDAPRKGGTLTCGDDPRITRIGRFLRRTKIDELPQLINVLKGEMSIVGPRPEVREYVECFRKDYDEILKVRPGITDLASLKFRDEAAILARCLNPEETYVKCILPEKIELGKQYVRRSSLVFDLGLIFKTLAALTGLRI
jgi:lipopolysaccharide/colanic/teichoic acid biosynthesis glycosyltransferase